MSCPIPVAPATPSLKDLPRVAGDLKSELEGFKPESLKNADTQEKIVLPSAQGMHSNEHVVFIRNFTLSTW